jgi:hypothetical protein
MYLLTQMRMQPEERVKPSIHSRAIMDTPQQPKPEPTRRPAILKSNTCRLVAPSLKAEANAETSITAKRLYAAVSPVNILKTQGA